MQSFKKSVMGDGCKEACRWVAVGLVILGTVTTQASENTEKKVCVEVILQEVKDKPNEKIQGTSEPSEETAAPANEAPSPPLKPRSDAKPNPAAVERPYPWEPQTGSSRPPPLGTAESFLPIGQNPVLYLKRLVEHFVTHEEGFEAVQDNCQEQLRVELYPLREGWTAFARYSGTGREERVDQLLPQELSQFAERASLALLHDVPISSTINRDTVLAADSQKSVQRIRGTHHFVMDLGTQLRLGLFGTAGATSQGDAPEAWRLFSPMTLAIGYRGKFENWGLEAITQLGIGTSKTGIRFNDTGGHIDMGGDFGASLHFLRYLNPRGLTSFYFGGGSSFELLWFSSIRPLDNRGGDNRNTLYSGGLDVDLVCGYEFMRASSVQFFLQAELQLPAYMIQTDDDNVASIRTWFPGLSVKLGVMF